MPPPILLCFAMFGCCLLKTCSFLKGNGGGSELEERRDKGKLGEVGVEIVVSIYCMRDESIFRKTNQGKMLTHYKQSSLSVSYCKCIYLGLLYYFVLLCPLEL